MKRERPIKMSSQSNTEKIFYEEIFHNREERKSHSKYAKEKWFNSLIMSGDTEKLQEALQNEKGIQIGNMSRNPFRQQLYSIIIGIATASRAAIEGGISEEEAFTLSEIYIREADACNSVEQLWELYIRALITFTEHVRDNSTNTNISGDIQRAIDYIYQHLHYNISLKEIADHACLSETYFSTLFKKETGLTVTSFIQKSRVEEAQSMLKYSDYSLLEIGQYLGFCSQSHFSKIFMKYTEMTPGQYRKMYFRSTW